MNLGDPYLKANVMRAEIIVILIAIYFLCKINMLLNLSNDLIDDSKDPSA
jgi:hypothetical protein